MNTRSAAILTCLAGALAAAAVAGAQTDAPAPTTRPAVTEAPEAQKPAEPPKLPRYGLLIRPDFKIIRQNVLRWKEMTPQQRRTVYNQWRAYFIHIDEEQLKAMWRRQKEYQELDPDKQKQYRRYARQVHDLVQSLQPHDRSKLLAMKPEARKKELLKIIGEMRLKGQWPPKPEKAAEPADAR